MNTIWREVRSWTRWSDVKLISSKGEFWIIVMAVAAISAVLASKV